MFGLLVFKKGELAIRAFTYFILLGLIYNVFGVACFYMSRIDLAYLGRYAYAAFEAAFIIWYCAHSSRDAISKKFTRFLIIITLSIWITLILFDNFQLIDFHMSIVESYTNLLLTFLLGYTILRRIEGVGITKDQPLTILHFGLFFYALMTIVIFRLLSSDLGERMYFIHDMSLILSQLIYVAAFVVEYRQQSRLKETVV